MSEIWRTEQHRLGYRTQPELADIRKGALNAPLFGESSARNLDSGARLS